MDEKQKWAVSVGYDKSEVDDIIDSVRRKKNIRIVLDTND